MEKKYFEWFKNNWYKAGGLIQPVKAGQMVNLSGARIMQIWKEQNNAIYKYQNTKPLIGWKDFLDFKNKRESNKKNVENVTPFNKKHII